MAKKQARGMRGLRGPSGPAGARGPRGERGERGRQGVRGVTGPVGPVGVLGPDADPKELIKALDVQVDGIYKELTAQMNRLSEVQMQLDEVRAAIRRLSGRSQTSA